MQYLAPCCSNRPRGSEDDRARSRRGLTQHLRDPPLDSQTELMPRFNAIRHGLSRQPLTDYSFQKGFSKVLRRSPGTDELSYVLLSLRISGSLALVLEGTNASRPGPDIH